MTTGRRPAAGPAVGAAAGCCLYGLLKLYWAVGGEIGLREAPLPQPAIAAALAREPSAVRGHWISVGLAAVGIVVALATVSGRVRRLPRWLVVAPLGLLGALMIARALLQAVGDVQRLVVGVSETSAHTARWDLALWSPFFLVWGVCWACAAVTALSTVYGPARRPTAG